MTQVDLAARRRLASASASTSTSASPPTSARSRATASSTDHAAAMIGQGKVLVSPMDDGHGRGVGDGTAPSCRPLLARQPGRGPLPEASQAADRRRRRHSCAPSWGRSSREGSGRFLAAGRGRPGRPRPAPPSTAPATPPPTHAWMVAARGDLAVAVYVETGHPAPAPPARSSRRSCSGTRRLIAAGRHPPYDDALPTAAVGRASYTSGGGATALLGLDDVDVGGAHEGDPVAEVDVYQVGRPGPRSTRGRRGVGRVDGGGVEPRASARRRGTDCPP